MVTCQYVYHGGMSLRREVGKKTRANVLIGKAEKYRGKKMMRTGLKKEWRDEREISEQAQRATEGE